MTETEATEIFERSGWYQAAALLSVGAGIVHASAAGQHADHLALAVLFGLAAAAQVGWAMVRPSRGLLRAVMAFQLVAIGCWALTRVYAISFIPGLESVQPAGTQDLLAVALETAAIAAGVAALWARRVPKHAGLVIIGAAIVALGVAVPASALEHTHGEHTHSAATGHVHDATHTHPDGSAVPGAAEATPAELMRAGAVVAEMKTALAGHTDTASVMAAGYRSIGDAVTGHEHFVNTAYMADAEILRADHVEAIVFEVADDGTKRLVSGMFILPNGATMADVPDVAGPLTVWHDHQNLCWDGNRVVGILWKGTCTRGTFRPTAPMLHVWVVDNECGPFAGIEGPNGASHGGNTCTHSHAS
jgi:hypothetical protein